MGDELAGLVANLDGEVSLVVRNLSTGDAYDLMGDVVRACASEAKIYVLLAFAERVAQGGLDPRATVELASDDAVPGTGVMRFADPGLRPSLSFLAHLMMKVSDNVATNLLLDAIGGSAAVQSLVDRFEIPDTTIDGALFRSAWIASSARALAHAAELLATPEEYGYPAEAASYCKRVMAGHLDEGLARELPWSPLAADLEAVPQFRYLRGSWAGIEYYGKAGALPHYRGDVAVFVSTRSTYVVGMQCAALSDDRPLNASNDGYQFSARVGKLLYDRWAIA